jgi:hypothetical protein
MSSDSAVARVFAIEELLESVLVFLSIDRLLILKRVCHEWNRVIASSPALQKILFMRPAPSRSAREHNPLFEDYLKTIGYAEPQATAAAHVEMNPNVMRRLINGCPKSWREMTMFQPPCPYYLTMPSISVFDITVKFKNEANVPIMRAVELANHIVELEAEKKRTSRSTLDHALRGRFARVMDGRLVKEGETLKRRRIDQEAGPSNSGMELRRRAIEVGTGSSG